AMKARNPRDQVRRRPGFRDILRDPAPMGPAIAEELPMTPMDALKVAGPTAGDEPAATGPGAVEERRPATSVPGSSSDPLVEVHGEPSYTLANREVELFVTRRGGHLAP